MTTAMVLLVSWLTKRPDFRGFTGRRLVGLIYALAAALIGSITRGNLGHYVKLAGSFEEVIRL
jgi:hypothetical protein